MLISLKHKFIFVANLKAGSSSIEAELKPYAEIALLQTKYGKHFGLDEIYDHFNFIFRSTPPSKFFKFGVIRDPLDYLVSVYNSHQKEAFVASAASTRGISIDTFLQDEQLLSWQRQPQATRLVPTRKDAGLDHLIRYDDLETDFLAICRLLELPITSLRVANPSPKVASSEAVTEDFGERLRKVYAVDYALIAEGPVDPRVVALRTDPTAVDAASTAAPQAPGPKRKGLGAALTKVLGKGPGWTPKPVVYPDVKPAAVTPDGEQAVEQRGEPAPARLPGRKAAEQVDKAAARASAVSKVLKRLGATSGALPETIPAGYFDELNAAYPEPATLARPLSQMCTRSQFDEPDYLRIAALFKLAPRLHRKQWEFVYIFRCLEAAGMVAPDRRGLVFGVGREKLPSVLASRGCQITATDLPPEEGSGIWVGGGQHAASREAIFHDHLVDRAVFDRSIEFRPVNMKKIPDDLTGYDFCWSACALEHLGSLDAGFEFIERSLDCLKPGGVAVHTTEFNLQSDDRTLMDGPSVVYRKRDLLAFGEKLKARSCSVDFSFHAGTMPTDRMIDVERKNDIHIRLYVRHRIAATSLGLFIRKG